MNFHRTSWLLLGLALLPSGPVCGISLEPSKRGTFHWSQETYDPSGRLLKDVQRLESGPGHLWAITQEGLLDFDLKTHRWSLLGTDQPDFTHSLNPVYFAKFQAPHWLWVATWCGLYRLDLEKKEYLWINAMDGLKGEAGPFIGLQKNFVWTLSRDDDGNFRILTGLSQEGKVIGSYLLPPNFYPRAMLAEPNRIWFYSWKLMGYFDTGKKQFKTWTAEGFPELRDIYGGEFFTDPDSVLFGTHGKLLKFGKKNQQWTVEPWNLALPAAKAEGLFWIGSSYDLTTGSRFVLRYIRDHQKPQDIFFFEKNLVKFPYHIHQLLHAHDRVWMATSGGLLEYRPDRSIVTHYAPDPRPRSEDGRTYPILFTEKRFKLPKKTDGTIPELFWNPWPRERRRTLNAGAGQ